MKIILEKINKSLLLVFFVTLIFKKGDVFSDFSSQISKMLLLLIYILTIFYIFKFSSIKIFFKSISRKIWILIIGLIMSVLFGWGVTLFFYSVPLNMDMVTQFMTLIIAISIFVLVLFYTRDDQSFLISSIYSLLIPIIYIIFLVFPSFAQYLSFSQEGRFFGFSDNQNVISKILLIPSIFFSANLLSQKYTIKNILIFLGISSSLMALLFWSASRGALLAFAVGLFFISLIVIFIKDFSLKKTFIVGTLSLLIIIIGFIFTPNDGKKVVLNRILNKDTNQTQFELIKEESVGNVFKKSIKKDDVENSIPETRSEIWGFYVKKAVSNPLGIGPAFNTHNKVYVSEYNDFIEGGSHNSYLEIYLWGGILGVFCFIFLLGSAFVNLFNKMRYNFNYNILFLVGILFALSLAVMFDDNSRLYLFWIIIALSLRYGNYEPKN